MQLIDAKQAKKRRIASQRHETKPKPGRPKNKAVVAIMKKQKCSRATAWRKRRQSLERLRSEREKLIVATARSQFCPLIKTTDSWNFDAARMIFPRLDPDESHGYIPGELYANCLFWFAKPGDLVVAPMAGSGMIQHVYLDRALWTKGRRPQPWEIDLRMFDLSPRGPYNELIRPWNILDGFPPVERTPDYVIADVPYFGIVRGQYSQRDDDLANMDEAGWTKAMRHFGRSCAEVGAKRCTIIVSAFVDHSTGREVLCGEIVREAWRDAGYRVRRPCYADRRIQQHPRMARWNNVARETLLPMSSMSEVLTFDLSLDGLPSVLTEAAD
jgi:hypothetical protein